MKECTKVERLTCIVDEDRTHNGEPLYRAIVNAAQENGIGGATVTRGIMGFGAGKRIHRDRPLGRNSDLPIVIRIVDEKDKLDVFSKDLCEMVEQGIILREPVHMCLVRCGGETIKE